MAQILRTLKIHRKSSKNAMTIFSPLLSEPKVNFRQLETNFGVRGTLSDIVNKVEIYGPILHGYQKL